MSVEDLELRHVLDDALAIAGLLSDGVAGEVELLQEGQFGHHPQDMVEVLELVVRQQENLDELEIFHDVDLGQLVVHAENPLQSEVRLQRPQISQLPMRVHALPGCCSGTPPPSSETARSSGDLPGAVRTDRLRCTLWHRARS